MVSEEAQGKLRGLLFIRKVTFILFCTISLTISHKGANIFCEFHQVEYDNSHELCLILNIVIAHLCTRIGSFCQLLCLQVGSISNLCKWRRRFYFLSVFKWYEYSCQVQWESGKLKLNTQTCLFMVVEHEFKWSLCFTFPYIIRYCNILHMQN